MDNVPSLEACRICANFYVTSSEVDFLNIFEPTQPLKNELVFIESELRAWQLNITCNDGLPQRICGNCFTKFCSIYAFREECIEAQQKLLQAFVEGDCAEEIVTAQDTTLNGLLAPNLKVEGEEIMGLESMLVGGHADEQPVKFEEVNSKMKDSIEMVLPAETITIQSQAGVTSQTILPEETFAKDVEQVTRSNTLSQEMQAIVEQDLEEVLQENYIPKKLKTKSEEETDVEDNDMNSSIDEEDESVESEEAQNSLACQYCYSTQKQLVVFTSDEDLSQHFFDAHDPTYPYTCPECPQKFNNSKSRMLHVKHKHQRQYHQAQRERMCQYCGKKLNALTREEHIETCQYIGDWECKECGLKFQQVTHFVFRSHVQREHVSQKKQLVCNDCRRVFTQRTLWENHLALHKRNTVLWCNECKEAFADSYELKKHKYKMHNGELPVHCEHCRKGFVTYAFLHRHMQMFHPDKLDDSNDEIHMRCKNCGMEFASMLKLRNHQQRPRDENGKCIDPVQSKSRANRLGLYPCPHCGKRFNIRAEFEKHILSHDTLRRAHKCEICFVMCRSPAELRQHHEIAHLLMKSFSCEKCGKKFAYKKDMRDHMLCHEERNIPCSEPDCGFICKNEKVLNDHIRQKHRLLPCEYCSETFTRQRLNFHMRQVHKDEIDIDVRNIKASASQDKVVVQFVGSRASNEITLKDQSAHQYPRTSATNYNPFEDYGKELIVEQEHEIVVT